MAYREQGRWRLWLCPAIVFAIVFVFGCDGTPGTQSVTATTEPNAALSALFSGEVQRMDLTLDEPAMAELAREPRDYVRGGLRTRGGDLSDVAIRFKGHRSLRQWAEKPAFKLNFGKYRKGQRLFGLRTLMLNNMVEDPTLLREHLAYKVFRALSVPAPRTGYVELFVNGQRFGLYAAVEPVLGPFISQAFQGQNPIVYEGEYGCDVYPGDVPGMGLDEGEDEGRLRLAALAEAANGPVMALLEGEDALLNPEHFFGFLAASVWTADFDGYRHGHNYRLYFDDASRRWSVLPWGLDRTFNRNMAPYDLHGRLAHKCFADPACRLRHVQTLHRAFGTLDALALPKELDAQAQRIEGAASRDGRKPHGRKSRKRKREALRSFLVERSQSLRRSLSCWDGAHEIDRDGDGHGCMDCDDTDAEVHPGQVERCDGKDRDCNGLVDDAPTCACQTADIEGGSFSLCDLPMSWPQAERFCRSRGEVLAHVDSKAQAKALRLAADKLRGDDFWIGLGDRQQEGQAVYLGSDSDFRYWASGEPDDYACGEDCAALKEGANGRSRDLHCSRPLPFVCRRATEEATP